MNSKNIHVVRSGDGWAPRREGASKVAPVQATQAQAIAAATQTAKQVGGEVLIHGRDGQIRERNSYHVIAGDKGNWSVRKEGSARAVRVFGSQVEAAKQAREMAKSARGELYVHGRDGRIRERNSYGNDPYPPKG